MAAVLGMQGTGTFTADERPRNWRQGINLIFPNGDTPLTAILSMMREEVTDDPEFRWFEKSLPQHRAIITGAGATTPVTPGADIAAGNIGDIDYLLFGSADDWSIFRPGHIILNLDTDEQMLVTSVSTGTANEIEVYRGYGMGTVGAAVGTGVTSSANADPMLIIGNGSPEGADSPDSLLHKPIRHYNFCQIFRDSLEFTRTGMRTRLRYDREGPYLEAQREAFQQHALQIEKALLLGERAEIGVAAGATLGGNLSGLSTDKLMRNTRGIRGWLPAASTNMTPAVNWDIAQANGGTLTHEMLLNWLEELFRYGSSEKLFLCGSTLLNALNKIAMGRFTITAVPTDQTYGLALTRITTPFGDLLLRQHPLLSHDPVLRKDGYAIDTPFLRLRVLDDTEFRTNVQNNGVDGSKDEFITELGLEAHHTGATPDTTGGLPGTPGPAAHGRLKGVTQGI